MTPLPRFFQQPKSDYFLFGPRGTGKSTWLRAVYADALWIDLLDAGVFRAVRPKGPLDQPEEIAGAALEGLVAQHLRAWIDYSGLDLQLSYWRTKSGNEVDFILYGRDGFWGIEVKSRRRVDGILCQPCEEFLRRLRPGEEIPA